MTHITSTTLRDRGPKGATIWLEGLERHGWRGGETYSVTITPEAIIYTKATEGKTRKVTASNGGLIDTTNKKVQVWAQGATEVQVHIGSQRIHIERVVA
jgi:hypothetical protein